MLLLATLTKGSTSYSARDAGPTRCANNAREEGNAVRAYIRGKSQPNLFHSVYEIAQRWIVFVIDNEVLRGRQNEVVKEVSVAAENVIETFHLKSPYSMTAHGSDKNGLSWGNGQLDYKKLRETLSQAVSGYAHLYAYGIPKSRFLTELLAQPVRNLENFKCPQTHGLKAQYSCSMPCHKNYLNYSCATRNAHTLFKWLKHHLHSLAYISCPPEFTRHTASFNSGLSRL